MLVFGVLLSTLKQLCIKKSQKREDLAQGSFLGRPPTTSVSSKLLEEANMCFVSIFNLGTAVAEASNVFCRRIPEAPIENESSRVAKEKLSGSCHR